MSESAVEDTGFNEAPLHSYEAFYSYLISDKFIANESLDNNISHDFAEYLYHRTGRPRWYIDSDLYDLLKTAKIDTDISNIPFTHDSFSIIFQRDQLVSGLPLKCIRATWARSQQSLDLLRHLFVHNLTDQVFNLMRSTIVIQVRIGVDDLEGIHAMFSTQLASEIGLCVGCVRDPSREEYHLSADTLAACERKFGSRFGLGAVQKTIAEAVKIVCSAMLYQAARPDLFVPYTLPRSQRYRVQGDREKITRVRLPGVGVKRIYDRTAVAAEAFGRTMPPHYRGWVLRTLRDPRFKRNPDGTVRVILVEPCAIHPELMEG